MYHKHVVDGVQDDQDDFGVLGGQQVDDGFQGSALDQGHHLLHGAPAGKVVHYPHSFPLGLEVSLWVTGQVQVLDPGSSRWSRLSLLLD